MPTRQEKDIIFSHSLGARAACPGIIPQGSVREGELNASLVRQVTLQVACIASFGSAPPVQLGYSVQGQVLNQTLSLPLSVGKFCTPPGAPVPREAFFSRWRAIAGPCCPCVCCSGLAFQNLCTRCLHLLISSQPPGYDPVA